MQLGQKISLQKREIVYFGKPGSDNTESTILLAKERAVGLGIKHVVVASTTGETGLRAAKAFSGTGVSVIVVTTHYGSKTEGKWRMKDDCLSSIISSGGKVITQSHMLSGVERSISQRFGGASHVEAIAESLRRLFGVGAKVCVEITIMAADTGSIPCGKECEIIAVGGTGTGADCALVVRPAHMNNFFDLEIREIICMPRNKRLDSKPQADQDQTTRVS